MLLTALLIFGVDGAARRLGGPRVRAGLRLAFVLALGQVLIGLALAPDAEKPFEGAALASFTAAGLTVAGFRRAEPKVVRWAVTLCLVLGPLPVILFGQMLTWRSWRGCGEVAGAVTRQASASRPVYLLIFDEWSLERSWRNGAFLPELGRLRRLAETSTVFTGARSPGVGTLTAIPRLLFGEAGEVVPENGTARWTAQRSSLFRLARSHGYATSIAGWYLPYAALFGDDLDACSTAPQVPKRAGAARLADLFWGNLRHLPDPLSRAMWRELYSRWFSPNWYRLQKGIEAEALRVARAASANTFAVFHFPLPHAPFIFEADGRYRGPFPGGRMEGTAEDYSRQLRYLDDVLGRFLDSLEASGRLDSALLIVTSDHSWKKDPDRAARTVERLQRVPLVVKWPGQGVGKIVEEEVCLLELGAVIAAAIGRTTTADEAARLVAGEIRGGEAKVCVEAGRT